MKKTEFRIDINASLDKVWFALWDDYHYRRWTTVFHEGSHAVSDWKEGSDILFLGPDGSGMFSQISEMRINEQMTFRHLGEVKNYVKQEIDAAASEWSGAEEAYSLSFAEGITTVTVTIDIVDDHFEFFQDVFPKALQLIKELAENFQICIESDVNAPVEKVWAYFTSPEHITKWNAASEDWHTPRAENDLRIGGSFLSRMESKDGEYGFDFAGIYDDVRVNELISYKMEDGRRVRIEFSKSENGTKVREFFDPETMNSLELQKMGWSAIMANFKQYTESN